MLVAVVVVSKIRTRALSSISRARYAFLLSSCKYFYIDRRAAVINLVHSSKTHNICTTYYNNIGRSLFACTRDDGREGGEKTSIVLLFFRAANQLTII